MGGKVKSVLSFGVGVEVEGTAVEVVERGVCEGPGGWEEREVIVVVGGCGEMRGERRRKVKILDVEA